MNHALIQIDMDAMINLHLAQTGKYPIDLYVSRDMYRKLQNIDIWDMGTKKHKTKYRGVNIVCEPDQ